jgi:hypothetical protein
MAESDSIRRGWLAAVGAGGRNSDFYFPDA